MNILKKVGYIFDKKQKAMAALLFVSIVIGAFVELLGHGHTKKAAFKASMTLSFFWRLA